MQDHSEEYRAVIEYGKYGSKIKVNSGEYTV
jgi:hypothetical protein